MFIFECFIYRVDKNNYLYLSVAPPKKVNDYTYAVAYHKSVPDSARRALPFLPPSETSRVINPNPIYRKGRRKIIFLDGGVFKDMKPGEVKEVVLTIHDKSALRNTVN